MRNDGCFVKLGRAISSKSTRWAQTNPYKGSSIVEYRISWYGEAKIHYLVGASGQCASTYKVYLLSCFQQAIAVEVDPSLQYCTTSRGGISHFDTSVKTRYEWCDEADAVFVVGTILTYIKLAGAAIVANTLVAVFAVEYASVVVGRTIAFSVSAFTQYEFINQYVYRAIFSHGGIEVFTLWFLW